MPGLAPAPSDRRTSAARGTSCCNSCRAWSSGTSTTAPKQSGREPRGASHLLKRLARRVCRCPWRPASKPPTLRLMAVRFWCARAVCLWPSGSSRWSLSGRDHQRSALAANRNADVIKGRRHRSLRQSSASTPAMFVHRCRAPRPTGRLQSSRPRRRLRDARTLDYQATLEARSSRMVAFAARPHQGAQGRQRLAALAVRRSRRYSSPAATSLHRSDLDQARICRALEISDIDATTCTSRLPTSSESSGPRRARAHPRSCKSDNGTSPYRAPHRPHARGRANVAAAAFASPSGRRSPVAHRHRNRALIWDARSTRPRSLGAREDDARSASSRCSRNDHNTRSVRQQTSTT